MSTSDERIGNQAAHLASNTLTALDVARAVRSRIEMIWQDGSVWGDRRTAPLRLLRGTRAWELFGSPAMTAAASPTVHACCRFGLARMLAVVQAEPAPPVGPATVALLGPPCGTCARVIHDETSARDAATGRPDRRSPRAVAATSTVTASAAPRPPTGGPRSPSGWERLPVSVPTPEEDRAFLASMARSKRRRAR